MICISISCNTMALNIIVGNSFHLSVMRIRESLKIRNQFHNRESRNPRAVRVAPVKWHKLLFSWLYRAFIRRLTAYYLRHCAFTATSACDGWNILSLNIHFVPVPEIFKWNWLLGVLRTWRRCIRHFVARVLFYVAFGCELLPSAVISHMFT